MAESCKNLPNDLWELILNKLQHHSNFEPLSLVSKQFLNLTNQLRPKLVVTDALRRTHNDIPSLINKRCPNIITIDLSNCDNIEDLLLGMASNCKLEKLSEIILCNAHKRPISCLIELSSKMRRIRVLKCRKIQALCDQDLVGIANALPLLEELDISYPMNDFDIVSWNSGGASDMTVTDMGIWVLSMSMKNLRRINVSGNDFVTDRSLVCLAENCEFLEGVDVVDCTLVTAKGVLSLLRNSVNLNSISASGIDTGNGSIGSEDMSFSGRRLCSLDLRNSFISEEFMNALFEACVDLKKLSLLKCTGFGVSSLALLLRHCHTLQHLVLRRVDCVTDTFIFQLPYLHNLVSLQLSSSSYSFTVITFHAVVERCPSLEYVRMKCLGRGIMGLRSQCVKYLNIKSLNLSGSAYLYNNCLIGIAFACPNLQTLDLSYCNISEKCLAEILDICREIRILSINGCKINSIGKGSLLPKLKVINAADSAINDEGLAQIAIRCPRVEKLVLARCSRLTDKGVKQIVRTCQILKELNLYSCSKVHYAFMVHWMISARPSLVKIVPPSPVSLSDSENRFFLQHGCQIGL